MDTNDLLKRQPDETAWRKIIGELLWALEILRKYGKKLDWELTSSNPEVPWTPEMFEEFEHQIDWTRPSQTGCDTILAVDCLERFADYWDWDKLSGNEPTPLDYGAIDRFTDR